MQKKTRKKDISVIILIVVFLIGLGLMLYPLLANQWNQHTQSRAIASYEKMLLESTPESFESEFQAAEAYNRSLRACQSPFSQYKDLTGYEETLNPLSTGVMGYITIDKIGVELPIYHGTEDAVLDGAVGHLQGTTLPIGGPDTHCVLSAHRGLPSAKLFTDLDALTEGDTFVVTILDRVMTYQVDQIRIVTPKETNDLTVVKGEDYCTLLTCTPYGINTHRLLVRGKRIENAVQRPEIYVANDAYRVDTLLVTAVIAAPLFTILLVALLLRYRKIKNA